MRDPKGSWLASAMLALVLGGCSQQQAAAPALEPAAKQAVDATRGKCPTDLNQTQVAMTDKDDSVRLIFLTSDPSQNEELHRRVTEVGSALADVHPAVDRDGKVVQHVPTPKAELREAAVTGTSPSQQGWELVVNVPNAETKARVKEDLGQHLDGWRKGECPILRDGPVLPRPTPSATSTPASADQSPGQDR